MKVSNIAISTVAAISMAGALGLAYAQTYSEPQPGTSAPTRQDATPAAPDPAPSSTTGQDSMSQDSSSTSQDSTAAGTTRSDSSYNERVARADRN